MNSVNIDVMDNKFSTEIYKNLMAGRIINQNIYKDGAMTINPLYIELANNEDVYIEYYKKMGFLIKSGENYFYLSSASESNSEGVRVKIVTSIIILYRFFMQEKGKSSLALTDNSYGVSKDDIQEINDNETFRKILKLSEIKSFYDSLNLLKDRGLLYQNEKGNYVLTDAGLSFFNTYISSESTFSIGD